MSEELVRQLEPVFRPRSVAVIGASNNPTKWGGMVIGRAVESAFRGPIYPVNPGASEIKGLPAYPDIGAIPGPVDLAVFTITAEQMPAAMAACVEKGVRGGLIISADFAETGERGRALQEETVRIAREGGIRLIGPNGNGMWSATANLNLSPFADPSGGGLAFVSQSGMFGGAAMRAVQSVGMGLSKFVSMGNQADLTAADYLEYLGQDDDTEAIAFYIEGVRDGERFAGIARDVAPRKPVLVLKGGRTSQGARATLSHTASIAGEDTVFDAMCRQTGVVRVSQLDHLFIMAQALLSQPRPSGNRIAVVGNGGYSVTTIDNLVTLGLDVPELGDADAKELKELLPPHAPVPRNPVDYAAGAVSVEDEVHVIEKLASLDYIDGIITETPRDRSLRAKTFAEDRKAVITAVDEFCRIPQRYSTPIITHSVMPSRTVSELLRVGGVPVYDSAEKCALAMYALVRHGEVARDV